MCWNDSTWYLVVCHGLVKTVRRSNLCARCLTKRDWSVKPAQGDQTKPCRTFIQCCCIYAFCTSTHLAFRCFVFAWSVLSAQPKMKVFSVHRAPDFGLLVSPCNVFDGSLVVCFAIHFVFVLCSLNCIRVEVWLNVSLNSYSSLYFPHFMHLSHSLHCGRFQIIDCCRRWCNIYNYRKYLCNFSSNSSPKGLSGINVDPFPFSSTILFLHFFQWDKLDLCWQTLRLPRSIMISKPP